MRKGLLLNFNLFLFCFVQVTPFTAFSGTNLFQVRDTTQPKEQFKNSFIVYKVIEGANHTYGYDIYVDGRVMIHQPNIPCLPGNEGFRKKEDADKVASFVISKIRRGIMPPTVTIEELSSRGINDQ